MAGTLAASLFGFARAWVVAHQFGAGQATDSFFAALAIPQTLYDNLIGVAIVAILIPMFARVAASDSPRAVAPLALVTSALVAIPLAGALIMLELFARPLFLVFASGFALPTHAAAGRQGVEMLRLLLPSLLLLGVSAVLMGALYALRRGFLATVSRAGIHVGISVAALAISARGGIESLAVGAVAGCGLQLLVLAIFLLRDRAGGLRGFRPHFGFPGRGSFLHCVPVRRMAALYLPVAASGLLAIVGVVVDLNFKSHLPQSGGLSSMQYATQLIQFPLGILAMGLGAAILPRLSAHDARRDSAGFAATLGAGLRLVLILSLPVMLLLLVLAGPITTVVFEHGRFGDQAASNTALALTGYAPQLPLVGVLQVLIAACYARHDTVRPAIVSAVGTCAYIPLAWVLLAPLTVLGLAIANTAQFGVQVGVILALTARSGARELWQEVAAGAWKSVLGGAGMVAVLVSLQHEGGRWFPTSFHGAEGSVRLGFLILVGAVVYGALALWLKVDELGSVARALRRFVTDSRTARYSNAANPGEPAP
jgi:putative peptidoglycan lipid II flippase